MATQRIAYLAQSHVRPVLLEWSRWLAGGVLGIACGAIIIAGFLAVAHALMQSFVLVLLLLISLVVVALVVFLPHLLPPTPSRGQE
ncbi:MAG: hypothetical protein H0X24_01625 [Ktedonobacterales bacterium]|nr:hypothetical protein [Ktedonobacterales bacterium]